MKEILQKLSTSAIALADVEFSEKTIQSNWLGFEGATEKDIAFAEKKLNISLPEDYKIFLKLTNGFSATLTTEPTFLDITTIDYLHNIDTDSIESYNIEGLEEIGVFLKTAIVIAGKDEEQYFLLIPPSKENDFWQYWKFANWIPGEEPYESLEAYFKETTEFINEELKHSI